MKFWDAIDLLLEAWWVQSIVVGIALAVVVSGLSPVVRRTLMRRIP